MAVTNNTHLSPFKRGAFETLVSVRPLSIQYTCPVVNVGSSVFGDEYWIILISCVLRPSFAVASIYPIFTPNDYLFIKHGKQEKPKWEVYADSIR